MHTQPTRFMQQLRKQYPEHFIQKKVLEAGGDVGCFFAKCSYTIHHRIRDTPVYRLNKPGAFDVVVHADALHYDRNWINTLCAMYRNLTSGGALIISCAGPKSTVYEEDDEVPAYYHPLSADELTALLPATAFTTYQIGYATITHNLEFFGVKK